MKLTGREQCSFPSVAAHLPITLLRKLKPKTLGSENRSIFCSPVAKATFNELSADRGGFRDLRHDTPHPADTGVV